MERSYKLVCWDDRKPAAAVVEKYLPNGEMWQWKGILFVPPELGAELGTPDDAILVGTSAFPAWNLAGEMPGTPRA